MVRHRRGCVRYLVSIILNFMRRGYTLVEIVIVLIIIGIVVSFAVPQFAVTKERALDKEAKASLALMRAAERIYKMELGSYYPLAGSTSVIADINTYLKLNLPPAASSNWSYTVFSTGVVQAVRSGRTWALDSTGSCENPTCAGVGCFEAGGCPP